MDFETRFKLVLLTDYKQTYFMYFKLTREWQLYAKQSVILKYKTGKLFAIDKTLKISMSKAFGINATCTNI